MTPLRSIAFAAAFSALALPAGAATTYNFFWTGDPAVDSNLDLSSDATAEAFGTFVIDTSGGGLIAPAQVQSFSLTFQTATKAPVTITKQSESLVDFFFDGTLAGDGSVITMRDLYVQTSANGTSNIFGCDSDLGDCGVVQVGENIIMAFSGGPLLTFTYNSTEAAQASLRMSIIPLPASLPLLLGALGLFAFLRRRRAA